MTNETDSSEILSQQEIDSLLQVFDSASARRSGAANPVSEVRLYDFRRPERFSKDQLKCVEAVHRALASSLSSYLSSLLRATVDVQYSTVEQCSFAEYLKSTPSSTFFSSFRIDPVGARCLIEVNPNLVFCLVDLMTGGDGDSSPDARDLTEIEMKLMESVIRPALKQYTRAWEPYGHTFCDLERAGVNLSANPAAASGDRVLSVTFEMQIGTHAGLISLCVPTHAVEAILHDFAQRSENTGSGPDLAIQQAISEQIGSSTVYLEALLGTVPVSINNLLALKPGDCVRLDNRATDEIILSVKGVPKYKAVPGVTGRYLAVQITHELSDEEVRALAQ
ncbi:MAG: flagellar motor switch protein FliM [Armatimonadetes bacterium]|nr:flagellar motor switch protein FliM [Armatimonadota bacterium]